MDTGEIYALMNRNPAFHLATMDGDTPRVRGMMLFEAGPDGVIFHSGVFKDVHRQILANPRVELCFNDYENYVQIRINTTLQVVNDNDLKDRICEHPTREFLKKWRESGDLSDFYRDFIVYRTRGGKFAVWTMQTNFEPTTWLDL